MTTTPVFSSNFLSKHVAGFKLSSQPNIYRITSEIKGLLAELEVGKLNALKEEEVKSRFIQTFFDEILGFNCRGPREWLLREEKKTEVDGTKSDAALGYFSSGNNDVRAVIEMKNAKVNLDEDQKRGNQRTPVDQAFEYAAKMGGACKWVIVSNMIETRFYPSLDRSHCQVYYLKDFQDEEILKQLLFLFHKDRFIREDGPSRTDKLYELAKQVTVANDTPLHIIDQLYNSVSRFNGFGYVDPNYLAAIKPFNILEDHVWHYKSGELFTLNPLIYHLLKEIQLEEEEVIFSNNLRKEIEQENVAEATEKIVEVFKMLRHCCIDKVTAVKDYQKIAARNTHTIGFSCRVPLRFKEDEGVTRDIQLHHRKICNCMSCSYRKLDFNQFISILKESEGKEDANRMELAFGNFLAATNNFKTSYNIYQTIIRESKGQPGKGITYFLAKLNSQLLYNLVSDYSLSDSKIILDEIKSIDLDRIIHDDLEFELDKEVREYLLKVKEDYLIYKLQDQIDETLEAVKSLNLRSKELNTHFSGPYYPQILSGLYIQLYQYVNGDYIVYDNFKRYRSLSSKIFQGLVWSHETSDVGLPTFNSFFLIEAILHVPSDELKKMLIDVEILRVDEVSKEEVLIRLNNFCSSYVKNGLFGDPYPNPIVQEQLHNFRFNDNFTRIFSNLFIIISKIKFSREQFIICKTSIIKFLQVEDMLAWYDLRELCGFIHSQPHLFESSELMEILSIAIKGYNYRFTKYEDTIKKIPEELHKTYPTFRLSNKKMINSAIVKAISDDGEQESYGHLIPMVQICDEPVKELLYNAFEEYLNKDFQPDFFEELLKYTDFDYTCSNYFEQYIMYVNSHRSKAYRFGKRELTDLVFINFALALYLRGIDFEWPVLKGLKDLNPFESWLINPYKFDYKRFDAKWLLDLEELIIIEKLPKNKDILEAIERELIGNFNPLLAELKYKCFYEREIMISKINII